MSWLWIGSTDIARVQDTEAKARVEGQHAKTAVLAMSRWDPPALFMQIKWPNPGYAAQHRRSVEGQLSARLQPQGAVFWSYGLARWCRRVPHGMEMVEQ